MIGVWGDIGGSERLCAGVGRFVLLGLVDRYTRGGWLGRDGKGC